MFAYNQTNKAEANSMYIVSDSIKVASLVLPLQMCIAGMLIFK